MKNKSAWYLVATTLIVMAFFGLFGGDNSVSVKIFAVFMSVTGGLIIGLNARK